MEKYNRIKALISLDAVKYNFEQMKKNIKEGTKIIAVIKADAYGHGAVPIAAMLENLDYIWGFATATAQEALQLRREGITVESSRDWTAEKGADPSCGRHRHDKNRIQGQRRESGRDPQDL